MQQVFNSFNLQKLKLFNVLNVERNSNHVSAECCAENLSENEIELLNSCFENSVSLLESERSSLYYICGYVAHKEKSMIMDTKEIENNSNSEFTKMVSRGKLDFPKEELFDLSLYLYSYYKSTENKTCTTRLLKAFERIHDFTRYEITNYMSVLRRFANCFSKAFAIKRSDNIKGKEKLKNVKKLRLSNKL